MKTIINRIAGIVLAAAIAMIPMMPSGSGFESTAVSAVKNDYSSTAEIEKAGEAMYSSYLNKIQKRKNSLSSGFVLIDGKTFRVKMKVIGKPDKNGYPLYIGLRGGGVDNKELAEEQYEVMQNYYSPAIKNGIYIVPQPVSPCWDEHYKPNSFLLYDRIIEDAVAFYDADPNRVYITGFSSGGDGVYAIAPRYADRLAAVNMSAGYPHVLRVGNMYNLPICLQMGELDSAYDRNIKVAQFDALLNTYKKTYGGGYTHETFIHVNGNHNNWDDVYNTKQKVYTGSQVAKWLKDPKSATSVTKQTGAVQWMSKYTRDPLPKKVVWEPAINAALRKSQAFYWLDCDGDFSDTVVVASYDKGKNIVNIEQCDAKNGTLKIYLNPQMLDVFKKVTVKCNGKSYDVKPVVSSQIMESTLEARGDKNYMFTSEINITFNSKGVSKVRTVSKHETKYTPTGDQYFYWDSDGLFVVDNRLFNLTYDELSKKLGRKLDKPVEWPYWGKKLSWTYVNYGNRVVSFMFQSGKTVIILSEEPGNISSKLSKSAEKKYGETNTFVNGGLCYYSLENNEYDNQNHIDQKYQYYKCK